MPEDSPVDAHPTDPARSAATAPEAGSTAAPNGAAPRSQPTPPGVPADALAKGTPPAVPAGARPDDHDGEQPRPDPPTAAEPTGPDHSADEPTQVLRAGEPAAEGAPAEDVPAEDVPAAGDGGDEPPGRTLWRGRRRRPAKKKGSFLRELPVLLITAFGLALLIKTFLVQAFFIPSGSMERTLHGCPGCSGDRVLVNKVVYRLHDPRQGDIVVFRGPESWAPEAQFDRPTNPVTRALRALGSAIGIAPAGEKDFVKRVIAVGGQTVECCDGNGRVLVDNRPLDEPYVYTTDPEYRPAPFGPVKVPEGRLWMMGDHRDESADSRVHISDADQGTIGVSDVIGKAFVIVWPPSRWDTLGTPSTFASAAGAPPALPLLLGTAVAVPPWVLRRRRRRGR